MNRVSASQSGSNLCDVVITNCKVLVCDSILEAGIAIDEGKIVAIGKQTKLPHSQERIDAQGNLVLPGLVDAHVHFRDPGLAHKEDFLSATSAAAAGGVTTVIDEPNNKPPTTTLDALHEKKKIAKSKSVIDYSFSVAVTPSNIETMQDFISEGIVSFDVFEEGMGDDVSISDAKNLIRGLSAIRGTGAVACMMNTGLPGLSQVTGEVLKGAGKKDIIAHGESHPALGEALGAVRNMFLAELLGVNIHVKQISCALTMAALQKIRTRGHVTLEVSPHHLLLSIHDIESLGPYGKVVPPIRAKEDCEALWSALVDGEIDIVATDHAPHLRKEKDAGVNDIWEAPAGLPGVETMLPLLLTEVNRGRISLKRMIEVTSYRPAQIFRLYPKKGTMQIGSDADLVVVDLKRKGTIMGKKLHSKAGWTPFEGWNVQGLPVMTIIRGEVVMEEGTIVSEPGSGEFVSPSTRNEIESPEGQ